MSCEPELGIHGIAELWIYGITVFFCQKSNNKGLMSFAFCPSTAKPKKTTTNMEHTEIKRYTKKELALLYFPNSSPATARRHLIRWIMRNSRLMEDLYAANYSLSDQYLTKEQVEIIFRYIGPP